MTHLGPGAPVSVEDDRLLPGGDRAVDAVQEAAIDQLVQQHPGLGVQRLETAVDYKLDSMMSSCNDECELVTITILTP